MPTLTSKQRKILVVLLVILSAVALIWAVSFREQSVPLPAQLPVPSPSAVTTQQPLKFPIAIESPTEPINAVHVELTFDPAHLQVTEISFDQSFATVFIHRSYDNEAGTIVLTGGIPYPGFRAEKPTIFAEVVFRVLKAGETEISYTPNSSVHQADGKGSNLLYDFPSARYTISDSAGVTAIDQAQASQPAPAIETEKYFFF